MPDHSPRSFRRQLWIGKDRKWQSQVDFAQHIEEGQPDIVNPPAADMLELAQTLQANRAVKFRSSQMISNGQRQFTYEETIEAKAGAKGHLDVPTTFTLGIRVFEGMEHGDAVNARLQFDMADGALRFKYLLDRPHDVIRLAFGDVVASVEAGTGVVAYRGASPSALV